MAFSLFSLLGRKSTVSMHEGKTSLQSYIYLTEIKKKGLIRQGVIYSLSGDRCWMDPRVGFTRQARRCLEFPSHSLCSPVRGRVCQEFKALAAGFLRTEGERRGSTGWSQVKAHVGVPVCASAEGLFTFSPRVLFFFFLLTEIRRSNGDVQECRSSPQTEAHDV